MKKDEPAENSGSGPKYRQIYQALRTALAENVYAPGTRLPSEFELAKQFGASRPTLSRALAQLKSEGLVERRPGSGTIARAQVQNQIRLFGLLIPGLGATEIFEPICRGIAASLVTGQCDLLWTAAGGALEKPDEEQALQLCDYFISRRVSGVFFAPVELTGHPQEANQTVVRKLDAAHIPVVLLDRDIVPYPERSPYDLVGIHNIRAGHLIADHVLSRGARRIVFLARPNSAPTVMQRAMGCETAVIARRSKEIEYRCEFGDPSQTDWVQGLLQRSKPDAIVCANDYTAAKLLTALNSLGVPVPEQIMVTGFDDVRYASMLQTPLTTIHQPCHSLGVTAMSMMMDRIAHPDLPARDCMVDFTLVTRESTDRKKN